MVSKMTTDTKYQFLGTKFKEYIHFKNFKETVSAQLKYKNQTESMEDFYEDFLDKHLTNRNSLDKIFFENILYGKLKNVFNYQLASNPSLGVNKFQESMKKLIEHMNKDKVPQVIYDQMSEKGFYLMESLNVTKIGSNFLAGFDFTKTTDNKIKTARFLITRVVPLKNRETAGYFIGGLDVNYEEKTCLIMIRNITSNIDTNPEEASETNEEHTNTLISFFNYIKNLLFPYLGISYINDSKKDKQAMFNMCNVLHKALMEDLQNEVYQRIKTNKKDGTIPIESAKAEILTNLFPNNISLNQEELNDFSKRLDSLILSTYINKMVEDEEVVNIAKLKKLIGFPTKIAFKSDTAAKGSTGSSSKNSPVATLGMFHSLYTDLQQSSELPQWSISWFTDYNHTTVTNNEVVQTTIFSTNEYFQIVFKNIELLNKELIYHVIKHINQYRSN